MKKSSIFNHAGFSYIITWNCNAEELCTIIT